MDLDDAASLADALLQRHGLRDWRFRFDSAVRRFGSCRWQQKVITLSARLTALNAEAQVRDTLLHEIAHALTPGDGHGERWKRKCRQIGADPRRTYSEDEVVMPPQRPASFEIGCKRCDWWADRRRRSRYRLLCRQCHGPVSYRAKTAKTGTGTILED